MATVNWKVLHVAKTTAEWAKVTSVISKGLLCVEFVSDDVTKIKIGDGVNTYAALPYVEPVIDLTPYYTKTQTDSAIREAVNEAVSGVFKIKGRVDATTNLPASNNETGDVYLVGAEDANSYPEYYWTGTAWEFMGHTTEVDLTGYYTSSAVDNLLANKVDKVSGKGLSTNDFTTALKTKLEGLSNYDDTALEERVAAAETELDTKVDKVSGKGLSTNDFTDALKTKLEGLSNYDDAALSARVAAIESDYITSADTLTINCTL